MKDIISPEEALLEKKSEQQAVLSEVESLFEDAGFIQKENQNTISFQSSTNDIKALFSIDNTTYNYECYITTEGENSSNYSAKGNIDGLVDAAFKFVEQCADVFDMPHEEDILTDDE